VKKNSSGTFGDGIAVGVFGILFAMFAIWMLLVAYNAVVDDIASRTADRVRPVTRRIHESPFTPSSWNDNVVIEGHWRGGDVSPDPRREFLKNPTFLVPNTAAPCR
jgi:hypothetical protein